MGFSLFYYALGTVVIYIFIAPEIKVSSLNIDLFILFPYIQFRYIPWKWKTSHSIYIIRQLARGITIIAKVERYL
jgi:hypothetical protein